MSFAALTFAHPWALIGLAAAAAGAFLLRKRRRELPRLVVPTVLAARSIAPSR